MLEKIKTVIRDHDMCVLATAGAKGPHTSLMAYACSADCSEIYLATPVNTLKFDNLRHDGRVSLLVDTRATDSRTRVRAVTINGRAHPIGDTGKKKAVRDLLRHRHPHLHGFIDQSEIEFVSVRIETLKLLNSAEEAHFVRLADGATAGTD